MSRAVRTWNGLSWNLASGDGGPTEPGTPSDIFVSAGYQSARVRWNAPDNGGSVITGYTITASPGGATIAADAVSTEAIFTGLNNATTYTFNITAVNAIGTGPAGVGADAITTFRTNRPGGPDTGYPIGTTFVSYSGGTFVNTNDLTFDGYEFPAIGLSTGYQFNGNNLIFRNCIFKEGLVISGDNILIEDCEFVGHGMTFSGTAGGTLQRCHIHHFASDGLNVSSDATNIDFFDNYIHTPFITDPGAHSDLIQVRGVNGMTVTNNSWDMGPYYTVEGSGVFNGNVFLQSGFFGGNHNITFTNNYFNGGGRTLIIAIATNVSFTTNRFGRDNHFSLIANDNPAGVVTATGNIYDDTGEAVIFPDSGA